MCKFHKSEIYNLSLQSESSQIVQTEHTPQHVSLKNVFVFNQVMCKVVNNNNNNNNKLLLINVLLLMLTTVFASV